MWIAGATILSLAGSRKTAILVWVGRNFDEKRIKGGLVQDNQIALGRDSGQFHGNLGGSGPFRNIIDQHYWMRLVVAMGMAGECAG